MHRLSGAVPHQGCRAESRRIRRSDKAQEAALFLGVAGRARLSTPRLSDGSSSPQGPQRRTVLRCCRHSLLELPQILLRRSHRLRRWSTPLRHHLRSLHLRRSHRHRRHSSRNQKIYEISVLHTLPNSFENVWNRTYRRARSVPG